MTLPEQPATFRRRTPLDRPWWWRLEDATGAEVRLTGEAALELDAQRFVSQADAESWIGEIWSDLAREGVDAVTLFERERRVYGPMSLHA